MVLSLSLVAYAEPYALVVGADRAPPGRVELRYAQTDAGAVHDLLVEVGGIAPSRVLTLLDPEPAEILAAIAAVPDGTERFVLYYSGHADGTALYPNGHPLPIADLKRAVEGLDVPLRIGVLDACRGGGWTGAKGLVPVEPFEVVEGLGAGTVYVSASTAGEDAHEVEGLGGSVFTHHWLGGLRGPADRDGDHQVTLVESFEWARVHTIEDSTVFAGQAQHPSFHYDVKGREDIVLADLRGARSAVALSWDTGEVSVHDLDTGTHVADLPVGAHQARLVLPPGTYLARRRVGGRVEVAPFEVHAGIPTTVTEAAFAATDLDGLVARKGDEGRPDQRLSPEAGGWSSQFRVGTAVAPGPHGEQIRGLVLDAEIQVGLTDRLALAMPAPGLAWRIGRHEAAEGLLYGGFYSGGFGFTCGEGPCWVELSGVLGGGLDTRVPLSDTVGLDTSWSASSGTAFVIGHRPFLGDLAVEGGAGLDIHLGRSVVLHPSFGVRQTVADDPNSALTLGSSLRRGIVELPLVQLHLTDRLSLDLDVGFQLDLDDGDLAESTTIGITQAIPGSKSRRP